MYGILAEVKRDAFQTSVELAKFDLISVGLEEARNGSAGNVIADQFIPHVRKYELVIGLLHRQLSDYWLLFAIQLF